MKRATCPACKARFTPDDDNYSAMLVEHVERGIMITTWELCPKCSCEAERRTKKGRRAVEALLARVKKARPDG